MQYFLLISSIAQIAYGHEYNVPHSAFCGEIKL